MLKWCDYVRRQPEQRTPLVRKPDGTYGINPERGLPVLIALCESCGYIMQFSAYKINME
ncbi:MAG: hypothetical protein M1119_02005 [Firmicutes bacterium]|nr:hypothetical protein [Bacillota bacterium]